MNYTAMHFYLISFFIADKNVRLRTVRESSLNNAILVLFFIMTMTISIELGAATGIVGTVALLLFLWLNEKNIGLFLSGKIFFVALMASLLFAVFVEVILSNSVVTYVITQLLGKDVTLSFRTLIYGQYTKELWINRRENSKSLAWSSVLLALHNIKKVGAVVDRPKALGDIRGVTYIYGMFYRFGLIDIPETAKGRSRKRVAEGTSENEKQLKGEKRRLKR